MKCYMCGKGELVKRKVDVRPYGVSIGKFDAEGCTSCNESFFSEATSDKIDRVAKMKGLWGLEARTRVGRVGNSVDVRISKRIADFTGLKKGEEVRIYPEGKSRIIIEAVG